MQGVYPEEESGDKGDRDAVAETQYEVKNNDAIQEMYDHIYYMIGGGIKFKEKVFPCV
jgi:hypothetical protein